MTRRGRGASVAAVAVFVAFVLGGCGGGGDNRSPTKISSKADFVAAGDKICRDRDERSIALAKSEGAKANAADLTGGLADIYADTIAKLAAIPLPPGAARAGAAKYVKAVTQMTRPVQRMKAAASVLAAARSDAQIKAAAATLQLDVNTVTAIGDLADQNARSYGFKDCGAQSPPASVA